MGNSIVSQLSEVSHVAEKQMIHNHLRKLLAGKKILIVLDDVWEKNPDTLKTLKAMLRLGPCSMVTVIVTTRDGAIAREICHSVEPYKLDSLTDKICWTIIKQKSSFKERVDKKQLKHIGWDIATKCGGLALAAQSLGYTLNGKTSDEWESVRDNYIWDVSSSEDPSSRDHGVLASLMLSYSHMPDWLKLCFSYCAIFPKGHNIVKYDLIHQWIALGFPEPSRIFDSMQLCEKYIAQLLGMSFLEHSKIPSSDRWHGKDVTLFTMHDLVHDLARVILGDQVSSKGSAAGKRCRYALLTDCSKPLQLSVICPENIKALHFLDCGELELRGDAFSLAKCLHVLDLSECIIQKLPDSVGHLKQLRFLRAPRIQDFMFPNCIVELSELNYINLGRSCMLELPESIGDMKGLMHLDLSGCILLRELPASFAELKQLVHLDLSDCHMSISEAFGGFTKLQFLNLSMHLFIGVNRKGLTRVIGNLIKLRYLNLSGCMKAMVPSAENQFVELLDSISTLSNLEHLDLSENVELTIIPESIGNLRKLHTLDLSGCSSLHVLPDSMVNMVSLKVLKVMHCFLLKKSLMTSQLNIVSLPHFVVRESTDTCSSNIILLRPTNPVDLAIDKLEYVKTAEEAQSIKLVKKQNIQTLTFQWTEAIERIVDDKDVLEKLVPPSSVQTLNIDGYGSASIPYWLMGITQYLPNLCQINLWNFPKCNNLPPLAQLPNLQGLSLCHMASLEEWNTAYVSGEEGANELLFPKLEILIIEHCAKLRIKPCLPKVKSLRIVDCDVLISSWGQSSSHSAASSASPLTVLLVGKSKVPLHQWRLLHQVTALRNLHISDCSDLSASSEIIQQLSSLRSLTLEQLDQAELPSWLVELTSLRGLHLIHCNSMTSLPQWLGEVNSLKIFEVKYCKGIRSLPDSIQQLTKLERLDIHGCPALVKWCESEDNKMKLAHIGIKFFPSWDNEEDDLCSAVMKMPGFTEEALTFVVAHLGDNEARGSAYMGLNEEDQLHWLINFLLNQNQIDSFIVASEDR